MKKVLYSMLALLAMATTAQAATDYGFYVGGVKVNSDNYTKIVEKSSAITSGTVTYDHSTKTLTLTDVTMSRSGNDNNGIDNYGCDDLKIVFKGTNSLNIADASVIQCQKNTIISCTTGSSTTLNYKGNQYRVIYLWGGNLTIQGKGELKILASGNGKGIEGKNAAETLTINNTQLIITSTNNCLRDLANVTFSGSSTTTLKPESASGTSSQRVENVKAMTFNGYQHIDKPDGAYFDSSMKTVIYNYGTAIAKNTITINANSDNVILMNETNFPDENFLSYVKNSIANGMTYITKTQAKNITEIDVNNKWITNLKGIEYFTGLKKLICYRNQLETTLDLSKNTELTELNCYSCNMTTLDLSKNTKLIVLKCYDNKLTSLDLSNNTKLEILSCHKNISSDYYLTTLDVSKNTALRELNCFCQRITSLDLSKNTNLESLNCHSNKLTSLNLSNNTKLTELMCYENQLTSLIVSPNGKLTSIYCYSNEIKDDEMLALVNNLPTVTKGVIYVITTPDRNEKNICTKSQVKIAKDKGWSVRDLNSGYSGGYVEYEGSDDTQTALHNVESIVHSSDDWYSLNGQKLQGEPTQKGIYIYKGKKIVK